MSMSSGNMINLVASYIKLLKAVDLNDPIVFKGIREGLNKFLSNAYLAQPGHKYELGHYYSDAAFEKVKNKDWSDLVFEHMVPKHKYIQKPCMDMAKSGKIDEEKVKVLVDKYWKIAIITKQEDKLLKGKSMPKGWDKEDVFYRYTKAGIKLTSKELLKF